MQRRVVEPGAFERLRDHNRLLNHALQARKIAEADRCFLLSAVLLALRAPGFDSTGPRRTEPGAERVIERVLAAASAQLGGDAEVAQAFAPLVRHPALADDEFVAGLVRGVDEHVRGCVRAHPGHDAISELFVEFLRYANHDKGLGIVLTPPHVAELFVELAAIDETSVVFDNCCGTGALLLAARRARARHGIEFQPRLHALAVASAALEDERRPAIHRGDCFERRLFAGSAPPTVGLLNPPYRNKRMKDDREELAFVLDNLDQLAPGGRCVAIVPITCATAPDGTGAMWKQRVMSRHTLDGVMSMPKELFHNSKTAVVTCIMVFTAHAPHPPGQPSWFGYWRDDGFVKTKHQGRHDGAGRWPELKARWVTAFRDRAVIAGQSVMRAVTATDEWCAEAYLETDYARIQPRDLKQALKRHLLAQITSQEPDEAGEDDADAGA